MTKDITFSLPAEAMQGAGEAVILGDFNNWNPEHASKLVKQQDGSFSAVVPLEEGETYHYRFLLDKARWVNDYNAQGYEPAPGLNIDNCVITVPESSVEENRDEKPVAPKKAAKKTAKVKQEQAPTDSSIKPVAAKAPKKAGSKTKATKAKGEKKIKAKVEEDKVSKVEKSLKEVKEASPKSGE